jgi:hypothetical protein
LKINVQCGEFIFNWWIGREKEMLIGPNLFFKCPECGKMTVRGSILSGNTFLSRLFSDGKLRAPMLPEFPGIVKCKKCKNF